MNGLTVTKMESARIPTDAAEFELYIYRNNQDNLEHLAMVMGNVVGQDAVLVRVHSECYTGDVLGSQRCDCGQQLQRAMALIADAGAGVIIYLRQEGRGIGLLEKLKAYNLQDLGYDTVEANLLLGHPPDVRDYTVAARILEDLGIRSVRLLTNNPQKIDALNQKGVLITDRLPLYGQITSENARYVQTKVTRMNHFPPPDSHAPEPLLLLKQVQQHLAQADSFRRQRHRPYVTLSYAQTVDGSIAIQSGRQFNISSAPAHRLTHQLRANHEAILVGINTVLADDPQLTVRLVAGQNPQPIILDSRLRCPLDAKLLQNRAQPLWIMTSHCADKHRQCALEARGAKVFRLGTHDDGRINIDEVLMLLAEAGVRSLMVEGGGQVITSFIKAQLVDQMVLTVAPMFAGGLQAVNSLGLSAANAVPHLANVQYQVLDRDLIIRGDFIWTEQ